MRDDGRRGVFGRLYHGETEIRFVSRARLWFAISGAVILVGLASLFLRGLNLGLDFEGGTSWEAPAGSASVGQAESAVASVGLEGADVQTLSSGGDVRLRVQADPGSGAESAAVVRALAEVTGNDVDQVSVNEVGPSWGQEITDKAVRALIVFLAAITVYITLRFEWKMAVATLAALVHDILVTVGVYSVAAFPVTPATVVAILTILGYSIYDGIVVFDRVDENAKAMGTSGRQTYSDMVNDSLNQVLMRTLNTSITALLPILSLLVIGAFVLGATTLEEFALALLIGLASGAYSSIFVASPLLAILKEREARYAGVRRRLEARTALVPTGASSTASPAEPAPAAQRPPRVADGDAEPAEPPPAAAPPPPSTRPAPAPARPPKSRSTRRQRSRKKGRR